MRVGHELRRTVHRVGLRTAIDGPAGAGKSTLGRALAEVLRCRYLDTGLMYRAVTLEALRTGVSPANGRALGDLAAAIAFSFPSDCDGSLLIDGREGGSELRSEAVEAEVSHVSAHPEVRRVLVDRQRALAEGSCIVMVGRDIGTVVLPDAPVKLWVTASAAERGRRRELEMRTDDQFGARMAELDRERDVLDSGRLLSPLRRAPDARVIDTSALLPREALASAVAAVQAGVERVLRAKIGG